MVPTTSGGCQSQQVSNTQLNYGTEVKKLIWYTTIE
jgi:hypothetical protein